MPTFSPKREVSEKRPTSHLRSPAIMPITRRRSRTELLWPLELRARLACMLVGGIIHQGSASIFRKAFSHCGSRRGAPGRWRSVRPRPGGYRIWNTSKATRENSNIDAPVDVAMTVSSVWGFGSQIAGLGRVLIRRTDRMSALNGQSGQHLLGVRISDFDPACVKTPTSNLRVESLSRLR